MTVESRPPTEILQGTHVAPPESEVVTGLLKKRGKEIEGWVANYFSRLPKSQLLNQRDSQGFYKQVEDANMRLENDLKKQINKISEDKKLTAGKAMLVRGICTETIKELNKGVPSVHPNSQQFVGQLARRIIMFGTEISESLLHNAQGNPVTIDRDWLREFAMDLCTLEYTYRLDELGNKLKQYVENPPTQPAD